MIYLKANIDLQKAISSANKQMLKSITKDSINQLFIHSGDKEEIKPIEDFTNEWVKKTVNSKTSCNWFIMTDVASMPIQGQEMTYILYKGYHKLIENGVVYYQMVDKETFAPIGSLHFSNQESNIFFNIKQPEVEESSCNAMEAYGSSKEHKKILFLIGHMNEERLLFDIERLIITSLNNIRKHKSIKFTFIINVAKFGGRVTAELKQRVEKLKSPTKQILKDFPNADVVFEYAED